MVPVPVLDAYGFNETFQIRSFGSGHIHRTYKIEGRELSFILQRINHYVFKKPELIISNIQKASDYLRRHHPDYLFLSVLKAKNGKDMVVDAEGWPWRLLPYIENTITKNEVQSKEEAFEAARGFARFTRNLAGCNPDDFYPTIDRFHDLGWRYEQFKESLTTAVPERFEQAGELITLCQKFSYLVNEYDQLISSGKLKLRITHNDTKLNNILFDRDSGEAVCVIDLDTLMPGYFIYDLGDMVRSFVSSASESEKDRSKIILRKEIYDALMAGYLSEMDDVLTPDEQSAIPFSGLMMTYIMALRFTTDFLKGDVYYSISYPLQNYDRAQNHLRLLELLREELQ